MFKAKVLKVQEKESKKGNKYYVVSFVLEGGTSPLKIVAFEEYKVGQEIYAYFKADKFGYATPAII